MIRPLLLSDSDARGGAARAAHRLHTGLREIGVPSRMRVRVKHAHGANISAPQTTLSKGLAFTRPLIDRLPLRLYPNYDGSPFSPQWLPNNVVTSTRTTSPDLVNLHWICNGWIRIESLKRFSVPIVWTLHDVWPFTGGCHVNYECRRYRSSCGLCPRLRSRHQYDLSRWIWRRKQGAWRSLHLTLIAPSRWMAERAQESSLFKGRPLRVIPHGLDLNRYKPARRDIARARFSLPLHRKLLLFGAAFGTPPRHKGFNFLQEALNYLSASSLHNQLDLVVFGPAPLRDLDIPSFKLHYVGSLTDDVAISLLYSAADVTVVPSIQESFGQVAMESLACGTPAVGFNATGLQDVVQHKQDGYLASPFDFRDLAAGIAWVLGDEGRHRELSIKARSRACTEFDQRLQAQRYHDLFTEVVERDKRL